MIRGRLWIGLSVVAAALAARGAPQIQLDSGLIAGASLGEKGDVHAYKGIPFAAPPVGDLRWRPPQAPKPWEGVRACTAFGPWCPQPQPLMGRELGTLSEDCLYLNVWTPAHKPTDRLPVMVWIHGGGHTTGSGASTYYDGERLAREGVVLVTINYRLGPFGYLAHPLLSQESEHKASGNYGLLDQIAALQWVQRNVAAFGGDPGCATIFGESAGSASVCRLMVSPLAKGLFHRAIAQSGGAHGNNRHLREEWNRLPPMEKIGEQLAEQLGCARAADPLATLRAKTWQEVLAAAAPAQGLFGKGIKFGPVVDGWALPDDPTVLFAAGKQHDVPFLVGSNADEGSVFVQQAPIRRVQGYKWLLGRRFGKHADRVFALFPAEEDAEVQAAFSRLVGVSAFVAPARFLVRSMAKCKSPAYLYHFTRVPPSERLRKLGAFHALEIGYVFGTIEGRPGFDDTDRRLSETMRKCWTRFARSGDPNGEGLPRWPAYAREADQCLEFGDEVKVRVGLHKQACDLFDAIQAEAGPKRGRSGKPPTSDRSPRLPPGQSTSGR
ncbi:MAG TPA: carboxylesterase/lipase family protein [Planctomycetota bacterium]|nr:carboxylesterase/lipase family protein [Planctomycetota bacterium]